MTLFIGVRWMVCSRTPVVEITLVPAARNESISERNHPKNESERKRNDANTKRVTPRRREV